jgi:catechol 2,3-dioxygenase-like lactoylglutathione lyase family enzyme
MTNPAIKTQLKDYIVGLMHIGHLVDDLDAAVASFKKVYGVTDADIRLEPPVGVIPPGGIMTRFAFVNVQGTEFELIEPVSDYFKDILGKSPCGGAGINHVAWQVRDIDQCMAVLTEHGIKPGHVTPGGVVTFGVKKLVYLDPQTTDGILIELIELL